MPDPTEREPSEREPGEHEFRSGFVSLVGRPNVGKSTLLNQIIGRKVSIVSDRPQTTRTQVRGVRTTADTQIVFLDTPGVHRPRTLLGERTNDRAITTLAEVDVVCFLIEANAPIGPGDRFVAARLAEVKTPVVLAVNKIDLAGR
jgi:GTP-binding protein Era